MIINFVLPSMGASGGIDVAYKYVNLLKTRGHDVCVYKELKAGNMHRYASRGKNILHQIYCTLKACALKDKGKHPEDCYVWKMTNHSVRDADVIIATAWPTAYRINGLSASKGRKYYFVQDYEIWDNVELGKKSYMLPLRKIVISTWINECLQRELGIGPFPIIYNGLDTALYHRVKTKKENGEISFLMLNHTLPKKGVADGLKAFEKIRMEYPACKLRMFGMCDNSNLPDYVDYYQNPSKQRIVELYSESDIFIFPGIEEGWGLTPLEAMACGCVVVGTNTGFVLDIGKHKENMMISEPGDTEKMYKNVMEVLNDNKLYEKLRYLGERTAKSLSWNSSVKKLVELLEEGNSK